jgi:4-hydroxy-4-methyl-2-oxoglutarate aldolase
MSTQSITSADEFAALTPGRVYESGPSIEADLRTQLTAWGVAAVAACLPPPLAQSQLLAADDLPRRSGSGSVAGVAVTVWNAPGSTRMNALAMEMLRPGDFVVLRGDIETPMWGDNMTARCMAQGAVGALIDGVARDVREVDSMGFSLWARRVYVGDNSRRMRPGLVNAPILVGHVRVVPGDVIVADDDGILAIPRRFLGVVADHAAAKAEEDKRIRAAASEGRMSDDLQRIYQTTELDPEIVRVGETWR